MVAQGVWDMLGKLVPCGGGVPIPLLRKSLVLGRKPECDITIPCATVSSRHCLLEFNEGYWWVRDLQSKNGTAVNGERGAQLKIDPKGILSVGRQRMIVDYKPNGKAAEKSNTRGSDDDIALSFLNAEPSEPQRPPAGLDPAIDQKSKSPSNVPSSFSPSPPSPKANVSASSVSRPEFPDLKPSPPSSPASEAAKMARKLPDSFSSGMDLGKLIPCGGGLPIPLRSAELILGRSHECDVQIRFASVSGRHCKLKFDQGYWIVEDLHSTNGTWVDGERCMLECLMPGSVLALDKHHFTISYVPRSDASPPVIKRRFSQSLLEKAGLADQFKGDRIGTMPLPDDDLDRPKRYELSESDDL